VNRRGSKIGDDVNGDNGDHNDDENQKTNERKLTDPLVVVHVSEATEQATRIDRMLTYNGCTCCDGCFCLVPNGLIEQHLAWHAGLDGRVDGLSP
jgi:hypothetical protein